MAKTPVGTEIKSVKVFDSKFESGAKQAAQAAINEAYKNASKHQLGTPKNGGHHIALTPSVVLDRGARTLVGTCKWEVSVIENGQRKMFPSLRQTKSASSTAQGINPDKVHQQSVNDAISGAVEAEVSGILKMLPA